jgi:hypothetical protein
MPLHIAGREYTIWLSDRAHELGMYWGLKNSFELIEEWPELVTQGVWDFGINEEVRLRHALAKMLKTCFSIVLIADSWCSTGCILMAC